MSRISSSVCILLWVAIVYLAFSAGSTLTADESLAGALSKPQGAPTKIALLDVARALKEYPQLQQQLALVQNNINNVAVNAEKRKQERRAADIKLIRSSLENLPEAEMELKLDELMRSRSSFNVEVTMLKKELLEKEAMLYHAAYQEITKAVEQIAVDRSISIVLKYDSDFLPDDSNRQRPYHELNKPILYQQGLDITDDVIAALNKLPVEKKVEPATSLSPPVSTVQPKAATRRDRR